ncbi:MAG: hypothetical protein PHD53_00025 [Methylococcales bacterium]|nr:hypothetical protein [Methylococcales bacterium]
MTNTESIEQVSENTLTKKIMTYVENVMTEMERKSSDFDIKREKIEQEMSRGARLTKHRLHL